MTYHPGFHPLVWLVEEPIYEGLGIHRVLLKSRERSPRRPIFHFGEWSRQIPQQRWGTYVLEPDRRVVNPGRQQL